MHTYAEIANVNPSAENSNFLISHAIKYFKQNGESRFSKVCFSVVIKIKEGKNGFFHFFLYFFYDR
jgi:hypothetical protein